MTIRELQQLVHANSLKHGFWPEIDGAKLPIECIRCVTETIPLKLVLIHSEISEALEEYRDGKINLYFKDGKPEGLGVELADAAIRILDLAEALDIDLQNVIELKHAFNVNRPYQHGRQRA